MTKEFEAAKAEAIIKQARGWKAKASGLESANHLLIIVELEERLARFKAEARAASYGAELAQLKLWCAKKRYRGEDVPKALTIRQLDDWRPNGENPNGEKPE